MVTAMKKLQPQDITQFEIIGNPAFSPDGTMLAYTIAKADYGTNSYKSDVCVIENGVHRRLSATGRTGYAKWTQDNRLMFASHREGQETEFSYIDPHSGSETVAFRVPLKNASLICNRNGYSYLSALDVEESGFEIGDCYTFDELPFWRNGRGITNGKRVALYRFNPLTGLERIGKPTEDVFFQDAGQDGVIYTSIAYRNGVADEFEGLYLLGNNKQEKTLCPPEMGLHIYFSGFCAGKIVFVANKNLGDYEYPRYYTVSPSTGKIDLLFETDSSFGSNINSDLRQERQCIARIYKDKIYFTTTCGDCGYLRSLSLDGRLSEYLTPEGCCDTFDISSHGELVYCGFYNSCISELYDANGQRLTNASDILSQYNTLVPEHCVFKASDGYEIDGWVIYPADYVRGKKYPAILHIHGGPRTAFGQAYFFEMQLWAAANYFVFYCNPRGSDGKGTRFANLMGQYGQADYANVMEFCDFVLSEYPDIDKSRIGVTGGSYGGFLTNWIIGHTDRFAAAVSQRSISNFISSEYLSDVGYSFNMTQHGMTAREQPMPLWDMSPIKYAPKAVTPTLFIQSEEDYRCYFPEALQMYSCLRYAGCDAKVCLFRGENHELSRSGKPHNRIRRMQEILRWMDQYLKPC